MARLSHRPLHLTTVEIEFFNNLPTVLIDVLRAVLSILEGLDIEVFLHGYTQEDIEDWNRALVSSNYTPVRFNLEDLKFSPIAQTHKR
ncbi:MAG: hypothetical protein LBH08_00280 [Puniceicoccales bacterium]|jgi:hypothetical protein|nr:hypothetical protein [Puniceicoccales bacterium]